ncbi:hydrogenase expression/formation protein HypE [Sulfobacillus acidophilus TPY]|uniref:AIR synthase related protein domain protein n=1 Tax=Sulfobacillus acidophilus (strain ATCC 700253 / DSM 10332 / NAL) TaxID=679936 RepID=G8TVU9_SULAD|nr:hydrogenase expression/formation protein HypE [Sulfobacillus acidophilus TPY]AEW04793.1 AIR synthase related protein domain protein [Sulfobacillus acidophilus DSM 10332]
MGTELPAIGKISPEAFSHYIYPHLGAQRPEILYGPQSGVDVGVVRVAPGVVMATTTDPVFVVPQYGWKRAAWFAVHILASDAATSGLAPSLMTVDLNLPLSMSTEDFEQFWLAWDQAVKDLGIAVISGHTARYQGTDFPMVGGATVMSIGPEDQYITTAMAEADDVLICTKGAAIETAGLFAATFPEWIRRELGDTTFEAADRLFEQMSVVEDARLAASVGVRQNGVTAMHDATECGVVGGVYEIAECSGLGVELLDDQVIIRPEVAAITELAGIDPLISISEGTLLLTVKPHAVDKVLERLKTGGIEASVIGRMLPPDEGRWRIQQGQRRSLVHPRVDPFWEAFGRRAAEGVT